MKRFLLSLLCLLAMSLSMFAAVSVTEGENYVTFDFSASTTFDGTSPVNISSGFDAGSYQFPGGDMVCWQKSTNNSYVMFQKNKTGYLTLPKFDKKVIKITVLNGINNCVYNITADDSSIGSIFSSSNKGKNNTEGSIEIPVANQAVGTEYKIHTGNTGNQIGFKKLTVTFAAGPQEPQELNLTFNPAEITVNENVEDAAIPSYSPAVDLTYTVKCLDADGDNHGLEINADNKTMTAYYPGRYEVTGSYAGGEDYLAGSGSFIVNVVVPKKELSFDFNTKQFNVNINKATPFSFTALDEEANELTADQLNIKYAIEPAEGLTIEGNSFTATAAGTYTITATATYTDDYDPATAEFTVTAVDPNAPKYIVDHISHNNAYLVKDGTLANGLNASGNSNKASNYRELTWTGKSGAKYYGVATTADGAKETDAERLGINSSKIKLNGESNASHYSGFLLTEAPKGYKLAGVTYVKHNSDLNTNPMEYYYSGKAFENLNNLWNNSTAKIQTTLTSDEEGTLVDLTNADDNQYFGIRSNSKAHYLEEIIITWAPAAKDVTLTWKNAEENAISEEFGFSLSNGAVATHAAFAELSASNPEFDVNNIIIKQTSGEDIAEISICEDGIAAVEFAKPGKATFAAQVAEGADLGNWDVVFPEELTLNVTPATIEFTEFPNGLKIAHQQSEYVANSGKHEGAVYDFEHDEADAFVAVPAHIDALDLAIVPAFEPEWDGVVTDEIIEKNNLTSEALIEDYHKHYHHLAYAEPIVGAFDHKNVYFSASVAGAYKFNFTLKDEYKEYFTEGNAKSYDFEITPELVDEVLNFYEAGSYIKAAVCDNGIWNLTEMENTGSIDHLEHVYVSTNHGGQLYYKVDYKTSDEPSLPEMVKGKVAKAADALEGYTLYNASGMDLRNARSLDMYQVVNGANTGIKHIDFVSSIPTGVAEIGAEADGDAEYYTLEGLRVQLPLAPGAYVVRKAGRGAVIFVK